MFVCFGVRELVLNLTAYCGRYSIIDVVAPSPAQIGEWIGGPRTLGLGFFRFGFKPSLWGSPGRPAGETTVNFIC